LKTIQNFDRTKVTMEDKYKLVCALSNGTISDDLE